MADVEERRLEMVALGELKPHPSNARRHKAKDLRASMDRFGYGTPILVCERTGYIAAGHGRRIVLLDMQAKGETPPEGVESRDGEWYAPTIRGWSSADDDELRAYLIADNRQTELGGWDLPELAEMLTGIRETDLSLAGVGYSPAELEKIMAPPAETVATENSYDQRADLYRNKQVRSIIMDYPLADYEFVTTTAKAACAAFNTETFAELFGAMLATWELEHPA